MKQYKFRAWDKYRKKMIEMATLHLHVGYPEYNIMQWTGLADCNGKDIYEGDILDKTHKLVIEWSNGSFGHWMNGDFIALCNIADIVSKMAIIGNIYENGRVPSVE